MPTNDKPEDLMEQPSMAKSTTETGSDKDAGKPKAAAKPKIGETIMGDDGITGRMY